MLSGDLVELVLSAGWIRLICLVLLGWWTFPRVVIAGYKRLLTMLRLGSRKCQCAKWSIHGLRCSHKNSLIRLCTLVMDSMMVPSNH